MTALLTAPQGSTRRAPGRWVALGVLVLAVLLVAVDATVLGPATPYPSEDLQPSGTQLLWIGDAYSFVGPACSSRWAAWATASAASVCCCTERPPSAWSRC
jgi:hypothetical protein